MDNLKIEMRKIPQFGRGVFARTIIQKGEEIAAFDGNIYACRDTQESLPNDPPLFIADHAIPLGESSVRDSNGIARHINHSCEPNCGIKDLVRVVAMRKIAPGEEISFDYDMVRDDPEKEIHCHCGKMNCRSVIRGYRHLPPERREQYQGFISEWLLEKPRPYVGPACALEVGSS